MKHLLTMLILMLILTACSHKGQVRARVQSMNGITHVFWVDTSFKVGDTIFYNYKYIILEK